MPAHAPHDRHGRPRRKRSPILEGLETRRLPSSHPIGPALPGRHDPAADVRQFVPILYPPGTPQPTPAEVARESFVAKAYGSYTVGPGHFNTQSITIRGFGRSATSNMSLRMHFQFVIFEPTNPAQPVTGTMNFLGLNYLNNGSQMILDLMGPTGTEINGLPTHLYWARDNASGGPFGGPGSALPAYNNFPSNYFNASGMLESPLQQGLPPTSVDNWNMGVGDAMFKYIPAKHPLPGTLGSGTVVLVFRGLINASGAQSTADKNYN
jgi:hypothetical protein